MRGKGGINYVDQDQGKENVDTDRRKLIKNTGILAGGVVGGSLDPNQSAVNNYLQMWEAENLFVVGASAFPHFGNHHPTPTVGALAYRATEGIEKHLKNGGGSLV